MKKIIQSIFIALILISTELSAQITLSESMDVLNQRYQLSNHVTQHPSLSLNGFTSLNDNEGLSVESLINKIYYGTNSTDRTLYRDPFNDIVNGTSVGNMAEPIGSCDDRKSTVEENSRILERLALIALISYVATEEGINVSSPPNSVSPLPTPTNSIINLKNGFENALSYFSGAGSLGHSCGDQVKRVMSLMNIARAWDFYLALENAWKYYEGVSWNFTDSKFLSSSQKNKVEDIMESNIEDLLFHLKETQVFGIENDEIEPGNRPLIIYAGMAYATMVNYKDNLYNAHGSTYIGNEIIEAALERSMKTAGTNSELYWGYQTSDGSYFWAEGQYYFQFALSYVLPFWHAIRSNDITAGSFTVYDPFRNSKVINPLRWLAETTQSGGFTAPIDDGNKHRISSSSILRWSSNYGHENTGKYFSKIANDIDPLENGVGNSNNLKAFELSVPRTLSELEPSANWGNTSSATPQEDDYHELVSRFDDSSNEEHYVYLNGEIGDAIIRGEGHEQPDQLQLLYSVGENSYIMDSGYDAAESEAGFLNFLKGNDYQRSTWNNYRDHNNTLVYHQQTPYEEVFPSPNANHLGGLAYPERSGISPPRVVSDHNSVHELYQENIGNIDILYGAQKLQIFRLDGDGSRFDYAENKRRVLFIKDPVAPYLIDLNMAYAYESMWNRAYFLNVYHGNSNNMPLKLSNNDYVLWTGIDGSTDKHLFLYADNIEAKIRESDFLTVFQDNAGEKFRTDIDIKRLTITPSFNNDPQFSLNQQT